MRTTTASRGNSPLYSIDSIVVKTGNCTGGASSMNNSIRVPMVEFGGVGGVGRLGPPNFGSRARG